MQKDGEVKIKSLKKSLEVLECFTQKQPLGVTEISEKLGLYKSNVHNILMTFTAMGYVEQDPESGKFRLGVSVMTLSRAFREGLNIAKIALPFMREIANEVGELVYLSIPRGDEVVYLEAIYPDNQRMVSKSVIGECSKMYCTSVGKAILSQFSPEEMERCIEGKLEAFTEYTITDKEKLREEIEATRIRGYGLDNMEVMFGIKCVGVAILNYEGKVEAGLSISAPSLRMGEERIQEFVKVLQTYAGKIQKML
ncbi:MAG: IclR family transcriptional regulator [Ruminococcus sp.]|nr:IclR family transcriptional regulator [Ruminococcus sp.]